MRFFKIFFFAFFLLISQPIYSRTLGHDYLIELGQREFASQNYLRALHYFKLAQTISPDSREATQYINLIRRLERERVVDDRRVKFEQKKDFEAASRERVIDDILTHLIKEEKKDTEEEEIKEEDYLAQPSRLKVIRQTLAGLEETMRQEKKIEKVELKEEPAPRALPREFIKEKTINLADFSLDDSPLLLEVPPERLIQVTSKGIERFLVIDPDIASAERIDRANLKIKTRRRGSTFIHIWDDSGRWTLNLEVEIPFVFEEEREWEEGESFDFVYRADWRSYYSGSRLKDLNKQSSDFLHWAGTSGPTPYGNLSGHLEWRRAGSRDVVTGYGLKLTEGKFFDFEDFSLYGFDFRESFSPLSFPGMYLRGGALKSPAFRRNIEYALVYGRERGRYYGFFRPEFDFDRKSYIQGARLTLFPDNRDTFSFNYVRGYGSQRDDFLPEQVFSFQSEHKTDNLNLSAEVASGQDQLAGTLSSFMRFDDLTLNLSFRNIEKDFFTISGRPPSFGEIGGIFSLDWRPSPKFSLGWATDIYQDRYYMDLGADNKINFDWRGHFYYQLSPASDLRSNVYYQDRPGALSPYRRLNASAAYNKRFKLRFLDDRFLNTYFGYRYQHSQRLLLPESEYRRDSVWGGLRLEILPRLYGRLDYTHTWLEELESGRRFQPSVITAGLDYYQTLSPQLSANYRVHYRREHDVDSVYSFLAGEDSLEGSINFNYQPGDWADFFLDGRLRNVWRKDPSSQDYMEADLRLGARIYWDSFFRWQPSTIVEGYVFKDADGDGLMGKEEEGIPKVRVVVGPKEAYTGKDGRFRVRVRARSVVARVDLDTVSDEYILTTPLTRKIDLTGGGRREINFGLSSQSGLYGVVFYDLNQNNTLDEQDLPIGGVKIILNQEIEAVSNARGLYSFGNIAPGKHRVEIDINSLPEEYLPTVPVRKDIEIKEGMTHTYHIPLKKK